MSETITDLEREKHQLLNQMNRTLLLNESQLSGLQSPTMKLGSHFADTSSNTIADQLARDKTDLENKYSDLFAAYNSLLSHNKTLCSKLQKNDSQVELIPPPSLQKHKRAESSRTRENSSTRLQTLPKHPQNKPSRVSSKRNQEDSVNVSSLDQSLNSSYEQVGRIRKNKDSKRTNTISMSINESRKLSSLEISSTRNIKHPHIPKQYKNSNKLVEEEPRKVTHIIINVI